MIGTCISYQLPFNIAVRFKLYLSLLFIFIIHEVLISFCLLPNISAAVLYYDKGIRILCVLHSFIISIHFISY